MFKTKIEENPITSILILFGFLILLVLVILAYHKLKSPLQSTILKPESKKVKLTKGMKEMIESLNNEDAKYICLEVVNKEGIRKNELKQILNLTQTRLDAALKILEKREIIKMTESANPEVFFDERFKEL